MTTKNTKRKLDCYFIGDDYCSVGHGAYMHGRLTYATVFREDGESSLDFQLRCRRMAGAMDPVALTERGPEKK